MNFDVAPPTQLAQPPATLGTSGKSGSLDLNDLLKKLTDKGLLSLNKDTKPAVEETVKPPESVPDLTSFEPDLLKQKYPGKNYIYYLANNNDSLCC